MNTLDACAQEITRGLEEGWPDSDMVRLMAQVVEEFQRTTDSEQRQQILWEPRLTGDMRWDAALAALALHLCRLAGFARTPDWTRAGNRFSPGLFWVGLGQDSALQAHVLQRTPAYFKGRGVMLNEANLVSV